MKEKRRTLILWRSRKLRCLPFRSRIYYLLIVCLVFYVLWPSVVKRQYRRCNIRERSLWWVEGKNIDDEVHEKWAQHFSKSVFVLDFFFARICGKIQVQRSCHRECHLPVCSVLEIYFSFEKRKDGFNSLYFTPSNCHRYRYFFSFMIMLHLSKWFAGIISHESLQVSNNPNMSVSYMYGLPPRFVSVIVKDTLLGGP